MEIIFATNKARRICEKAAGKLKRRLDDIIDADNMEILLVLPGNCHPLKENRKGQWAIDAGHPKRLIFTLLPDDLPVNEDGRIDLKNVTSIKIIEVEDYHGK